MLSLHANKKKLLIQTQKCLLCDFSLFKFYVSVDNKRQSKYRLNKTMIKTYIHYLKTVWRAHLERNSNSLSESMTIQSASIWSECFPSTKFSKSGSSINQISSIRNIGTLPTSLFFPRSWALLWLQNTSIYSKPSLKTSGNWVTLGYI